MTDLRWLADPRLSPDGTRVAYVSRSLDHDADLVASRVGVVPVGGGPTVWFGTGAAPRWSPDGRLLAVSRGETLWVVDVATGAERQIARQGGGEVTEAVWSADGHLLAVARAAIVESANGIRVDGLPGFYRRHRRIQVVDLDGRPQWTLPGDARAPQWSPQGARLAFLTDRFSGWGDLCVATGPDQIERVTDGAGPVRGFAWCPDGARLAYLGHKHGDAGDVNLRLFLTSPAAELTTDWTHGLGNPVRGDDPRGTGDAPVVWSAASDRIYTEVAVGGRGPLAWFAPASGRSGRVFDGAHTCLSPSVGGGRIAFVRSDALNPGDVHVADEPTGRSRAVTEANPSAVRDAAPMTPVPVEGVDAWLTAHGGGRQPLLVNVHGGPHGAVGWRHTAEVQRLAARGYAVLTLNPRGSQGYGEEFATAIRGDWGGADWQDVTAAVDAAAALPGIDPRRMAIWGVSYGGFMTQWAIAHTDRFACAVSENGISDFLAAWASPFCDLPMGGPPWSSPRFVDRSPLVHADRIRTPLLLVHAEHDHVCPVAQSEQMHAALRLLGRDVALVRIPGEGHLMNLHGRPSSRARRAAAIDDFLDRHLRPSTQTNA
ncbi:S9 family peptidase [Asanoa iriomotensis]|uniref:Peptidase n=1 Tax=Asanoa iriomotensis TaxID=234613 RepID=A0ABQ4C031_9ACTN|nr:S9 family peptidase [Asanoa iriomotensis]GIF56133.1 peptidase [Asanoa iriomotensis]